MKALLFILSLILFGQLVLAAPPAASVDESHRNVIVSVEPEPSVKDVSQEVEPLLGYQAWKQRQVFRARAALDNFKTPKGPEPTAPVESDGEDPEVVENSEEKAEIESIQGKQAERLRQLEFNLEIALGLTIHDYFFLYLKNKTQAEIATVIPKLSADELSSLLVAYRRSVDGGPVLEKENKKPINQNL